MKHFLYRHDVTSELQVLVTSLHEREFIWTRTFGIQVHCSTSSATNAAGRLLFIFVPLEQTNFRWFSSVDNYYS